MRERRCHWLQDLQPHPHYLSFQWSKEPAETACTYFHFSSTVHRLQSDSSTIADACEIWLDLIQNPDLQPYHTELPVFPGKCHWHGKYAYLPAFCQPCHCVKKAGDNTFLGHHMVVWRHIGADFLDFPSQVDLAKRKSIQIRSMLQWVSKPSGGCGSNASSSGVRRYKSRSGCRRARGWTLANNCSTTCQWTRTHSSFHKRWRVSSNLNTNIRQSTLLTLGDALIKCCTRIHKMEIVG